MNDMKRHVGKLRNTDRRCIVVLMQIPDKKDHALVVDSDALPDRWHDAVIDVVESAEGQQATNLFDVLSRRILPDTGADMLNSLHTMGRLMPVPVDQVVMLPRPNMPFPLRQVIETMGGNVPAKTQEAVDEHRPNRIAENQQATADEGVRGIALNIIAEAVMLEGEARRKREQAYNMCPSLRPAPAVAEAYVPEDQPVDLSPEEKLAAHLERVAKRAEEERLAAEEAAKPKRPVGRPKKNAGPAAE